MPGRRFKFDQPCASQLRLGATGRAGVLFLAVSCASALVILRCAAPADGADAEKRPVRTYESAYYIIHSDLDRDKILEAHARMTAVAREYHRRTRGFAGKIRKKMPFYLFRRREDYIRNGGVPGSAGLFSVWGGRAKLMAYAGNSRVWHTVQHEAFHQFAYYVIRGKIPIWVNEGLAEYFGSGLWTGDGLVTGIIPPARLRRIKRLIKSNQMLPFARMLRMNSRQWSASLNLRNYDQAWSMCHFLIHANDGKYSGAFSSFISDISRGRPAEHAFAARFGKDIEAFQKRYSAWWRNLPEHPTANLYTEASVHALTSYLARGQVLQRKFTDAKAFFRAARDGKLQVDPRRMPRLWLPDSLLEKTLKKAGVLGDWSLETGKRRKTLVLKQADGAVFRGTYRLHGVKSPTTRVEVIPPGKAKEPAGKDAKGKGLSDS